jgi:hypothetical protein
MQLRKLIVVTGIATGHLSGQLYDGEIRSGGIGVLQQAYSHDLHGTVSVGIAISEGIVLAADSRMTTNTRVISDNASKLFDVGRIGIATYGQAFLERRNLASWVDDFRPQHQALNIERFAREFSDFIGIAYDRQFPQTAAIRPALGFLIAGYDDLHVGRLMQVDFPDRRQPALRFSTQATGAQWAGNTDVISRLVLGFDPRIGTVPPLDGLTPEERDAFRGRLNTIQYNIPFDALTLQDGIDLALSLVRTTVEMQRFADGTIGAPGQIPSVGGAVDVLVITPFELRWIRRKELKVE